MSTVKKSVASTLWAWERKNSGQVGPLRGTGPRACWRRTRRIELADPDTKLSELTLDTHTSPASVLSTETNDEPDQFVAHPRSARASLLAPSPPFVLGRFSVPPQQCVGSDHEGPPPGSRQQPTERGEDRPIYRSIARPGVQLTFENPDLVSEHHDLDVSVRLGSSERRNEAEDATQADVEEREGHGG